MMIIRKLKVKDLKKIIQTKEKILKLDSDLKLRYKIDNILLIN